MIVKKVIFLVDMNAFFISCETVRNPELMKKPAAVAGNPKTRTGIILTANYEARKYGVRTAMTVNQALRLCPHILFVPPDHHYYREKSCEVMDLLYQYTPMLEQNSIDEAWLDMTGTEYLFGKPIEAAQKIMKDIKDQLGLWCSIGISENKFLAKMASEMKKPLGITKLWGKEVPSKMWHLPIQSMYGIGGKTAEKLQALGIKTIGQLAHQKQNYLYHIFRKQGIEMHQHANGKDFSLLKPNSIDDMKSIGRSTTLPEDVKDIERLKVVLMELSEDVGRTARKHHKKGRVVSIVVKFSDFTTMNRQTTLAPTYFTKDIFETGYDLLKKSFPFKKPIRLIGITLKGFEENISSEQLSFFQAPKDSKHEKIDKIMDEIKNKYGSDKITRASLIKNDKVRD